MTYLTGSGATSIAIKPYGIHIQVNAALTGTLTVTDGTATVAIITNPTVGSFYRYWGFNGEAKVNPNGSCDVTVSVLNHQG
jgi:hypothetical protein